MTLSTEYNTRLARENRLAEEAGGARVNHSLLLPGDCFRIYMNDGECLGETIFVHDDLDGCAYVHDFEGRDHLMTGEAFVVRIPNPLGKESNDDAIRDND